MKQNRKIGYSEETRQFLHGNRADYCVYGDGTITRTWKRSMIEEKVAVYTKHGKAYVKCDRRDMVLKHIVAAAFLPEYRKGAAVVCIDHDEMNCAVDNLCVMTAKHLGRLTGHKARSEAVIVLDKRTGEIKNYRSIRRAAVGLCCSYQTMLDYINGKVKNSVLNDYQIKKIREVKK